jgi:class 3 adenylate cyclase/tetratricopeptide (TPR) repeat protein
MAHPHERSSSNARSDQPLRGFDPQRMGRYLPPDLSADLLAGLDDASARPARLVEAFVHLACARSVIATYLPRLLSAQLLEERLESPWLRWVEGSLLFADLSGSTALAERLSALGREGTEMVTAFLNQIFTALIAIIQDYGGDLVAFGGDALLVFFGDDRHPRTAARAALALQDLMHDYVQEVPGVGSFPMHLHVGVESGPVAFVSAGGADELHYSVLGGTVNGVARAEGFAQPNEVVVGPRAWQVLVDFARGEQVADGFYRISSMRAPARPHAPLPPEEVISAPPEQAIPALLDDLDRISRYIPAALLRRILAEPQQPQIEADLRPVTVLFAQVVGLEQLAEALNPAPAARAIQVYVSAMQAAVEQFGGVVNKLDVADEGVKLVAIFGAPAAYEDHAERAARSALAMQHEIESVKLRIEQIARESNFSILNAQFSIPLQRIGLNLGTAFAGNVGSPVRKEYTVMGDAVNVAARVMSKAEWGQVWCSEAAAQAIASRVECADRGFLALKGKALPLQLFQLIGERDAPAALARGEGPLIGREADLGWLRQRLDAALRGDGGVVRIVGEAGVGKSRLTAALLEQAAARGARVIAAACFSYTASIPYAAWAEWLKALCQIASGDGEELRAQKIAARLAELGPGMEEWLPLLGDLARLDVAENRLTRGLDPQLRQARRFELLEQLLLRAAADGPVLVLFEDLHWADPISLDLWRRGAGAVAGHPVLLLGVHRPADALDSADRAEVLDLKELSNDQSGHLVAALSGGVELPEPLVRKLVERSAGNPLFLAELLRAVLEKLQIDDFRLQIEEASQSAIYNLQSTIVDDLPDSLNGLLLSRIDRLDDSSRSILRVASVIGQRIPFGVLQSIQSFDQQALMRELARLDAENMTALERAEPERVHSFRHALIQEVAYQSMLYARRRELHGRIGEYLERRYGPDLDDYYGLLAHHYRLSDRRDKAIEYLVRAGQAAQAIYANEEALQYFGWALDALAGDDADARAWAVRDALGDVYATVGRYDEALAQHAAIIAAAGAPPDTVRRAHRKRGSVLEKQGHYAAALEELDQAMAIARSGAPGISPLAISLITADIGLVRQRLGEYDLAIAACEEGLRAVRDDPNTYDDEKIEARLHSTLGAIYGMRGDYPRARENFEHSLKLRTAVDDLAGMVASHNNLGYLWQLQSEYDRAIEHYAVAEELAKKINLRYALIFATLNRAYALIGRAEYAEARACSLQALDLSRQLNDQYNIAQSLNTLGIVFYHVGSYADSLGAYDEAVAIYRAIGSGYQEANTLMHLALTLCAQDRFAEAAAAAGQALERAEALRSQGLQAESLVALAEAALGQGDLATTAGYAERAAQIGRAIGSKRELAIARSLLGQVAARQSRQYAPAFDESLALLGEINDRFQVARVSAAYGVALAQAGNQSAGQTYLKQAQDTFISIGAAGELQRLSLIAERSV